MKIHLNFRFTTCVLLCTVAMPFQSLAADDIAECANEFACIEVLYEEKKYDPIDFANTKLFVGGKESVLFDDNIFRSSNNEKSDFVNHFMPQVALESNLNRHAWKLEAMADNTLHFSHSENNYTDASLMGEGRYDFSDETRLFVNGGYALDHVPIGAFVDEPNALDTEPTAFHTFSAHGAVDYLPLSNPWHLNAGLGTNVVNYENVERVIGINIQDDRDRVELVGTAQLGYRLTPNTELYLSTSHTHFDHDERIDSSALASRDATQHRYLVGYRHGGQNVEPFTYDVAIGYLERDYEESPWPAVQALDFYANAHWAINPANSVKLLVSRDTRDAYSTQRSAYLRTQAQLSYEYQFNEPLRLGAGYNYINYDFETRPGNLQREDDVHGIRLWSAYEFTRNIEGNLYYKYTNRDSNDPNADYNQNVIGIALAYKH